MPDLTRRHRLSDLEAQIRENYAHAARNLWRTGRALAEVRDEELWRDAGFPGFDAWLQSTGLLGRSSAYKAMLIASEFSEDQAAAQLGHKRRQRGVSADLRGKLELLHRDLAKAKPSLKATKVAARQDKRGRVLVSAMPLGSAMLATFTTHIEGVQVERPECRSGRSR